MGGGSSTPQPLPFFTYDSNRVITGLVQDESVNDIVDNVWYIKEQNKTFTDSYATGIGNDVFNNYSTPWMESTPVSVSLPNATSIGDGVFNYCTQLTTISIPNVTSIGEWAFSSCVCLTSISLPNTTSIGDNAFLGCQCLSSISIPNATSIGQYAFYGCSSDLVIDLSQNPNFSVANEESYRSSWDVPEGITIIFIDSPAS